MMGQQTMKAPLDYGLHHEEFRTYQQDSADWILALNEFAGGRTIGTIGVIQAPTGSGKTALAKSAAYRYSATSLCRTKALQRENYGHLYGFDLLFGRRNYPCVHKDARGDATAGDCRFSEVGMYKCPDAGECPYLTQKAIVQTSGCRSLNYYYWLAARWPRSERYATDYLVLDECHELPALVTDWAGTYVSEASRREWELPEFPTIRDTSGLLHKPKDYTDPHRAAIDWFANVYQELGRQYKWLSQRVDTEKHRKRVRQCESFGFKIAATLQALDDSPLDWFIKSGSIVGRDRNGRPCPAIITRPLTARHHFRKLFTPFQTTVLMSATIGNFDALAEELGIDTYSARDVPSIWPPESRPVYTFTNAPRLGHKSPPEDYALQADIISKAILGCPPEWSGIIHVTRKTEATILADRLARRGLQDRIVAMPQLSTDQQMTWWQNHKLKTPNAITVSWAWMEGVDLGEERICISAKVNFPYIGSDFERARMKRSGKMFLQRAAWGLEQSLGRTRRGRAQDYDLDGEHRGFVAIVDENWRRVRNYLSTTLLESIVEREFPL